MYKRQSLDNAVVLSGDQVLNKDGLRYENEFVRHKILDCIGDLYLVGAPIIGHFIGNRSGHALNHKILHELLKKKDSWRYTMAQRDYSSDHSESDNLSLAATA